MRRIAMLMALLCSAAQAQSVKLPPEIRGSVGAWIIIAPLEAPDGGQPKWRLDPGLQDVRLDLLFGPEVVKLQKGRVVTAASAGVYKVEAWNAKADVPSDIATCIVIVGTPIPPTPVPPTPVPIPPTPVPPNPTPAGLRTVLILRESADTTPELARVITSLRAGQQSQYIKSKGHSLLVLQIDDVGSDGKPLPVAESWKREVAGLTMPVLIIIDQTTKQIVAKFPLPKTADGVIETLKSNGG